jgi:hypothetical protein
MEELLPIVVSTIYPHLKVWKIRLRPGKKILLRFTWRGFFLEYEPDRPSYYSANFLVLQYLRGFVAHGGYRRAYNGKSQSTIAFFTAHLCLTCAVGGAQEIQQLFSDGFEFGNLKASDLHFPPLFIPLQRAVVFGDLTKLVPDSEEEAERAIKEFDPDVVLKDPTFVVSASERLAELIASHRIGEAVVARRIRQTET